MSAKLLGALLLLYISTSLSVTNPVSPFDSESFLSRVGSQRRSRPKLHRQQKATVKNDGVEVKWSNGGPCSWDNAVGTCTVSQEAAAKHFLSSDSPYAQYIGQFERCVAAKDEGECMTTTGCLWDSDRKQCLFVRFVDGHEDSPCVAEAPASVATLIESQKCALLNMEACNVAHVCEWSPEHKACGIDIFYPFFEFTDAQFKLALQFKMPLFAQAIDKFVRSRRSLTWTEVRQWRPSSPLDCHPGLPPNACLYADAVLGRLVPVEYYCQGRYGSLYRIGSCLLDEYCKLIRTGFSFKCQASDDQSHDAAVLGFEDIIPKIEHEVDQDVMRLTVKCSMITQERECTGDCLWINGQCGSGDSYLWKSMAQKGGEDDPVCSYASAVVESGCVDIENAHECYQKADCVVQTDDECITSAEYLVADVLLKDASVKTSFGELKKKCAAYGTSETCDAAIESIETVLYEPPVAAAPSA